MAHPDAGRRATTDPITPDVRERLRELIASELGAAWDAAVNAGADPDELARILEQRRRQIESTTATATADDEDR